MGSRAGLCTDRRASDRGTRVGAAELCFLAFTFVALCATGARAAGAGWDGSAGSERLRVFVLDTRTETGVALVDARDVDRVVAQTLSKYASSFEVFDVRSTGDALEQERLKDVLGCAHACLADITRAMHAQSLFGPAFAHFAPLDRLRRAYWDRRPLGLNLLRARY